MCVVVGCWSFLMTTASRRKVKGLEELAQEVGQMRSRGKRVVHCHGVFDLVHIGHIRYLERARQMGDALVVTVTPDRFVNKGPNRPAFPEGLRAEAVAALDCVDLAAVNRWPTAVEAIGLIKPDLYVKGSEYRRGDMTGAIGEERRAVESVGGSLAFTDEITFSSSNLLNRYMPSFPEETQGYLAGLARRHPVDSVLDYFERIRPLKVLVVGEAIIDEYQYCDAIGKSSKEPTLVVKAGQSERFAGGILAVANHVSSFCDRVTMVTQLGERNPQEEFIREHLSGGVEPVFVVRHDAPTIVKRRFIDPYFFVKLLEVYEINDNALTAVDDEAVCEALSRRVGEFDVVIVVDFGHSMISERAVRILCEKSKFLALNTQANAGNLGFNTLSKYPRADYICVAENEMRLEARQRGGDLRGIIEKVTRQHGCKKLVVTRGKRGSLCYDAADGFFEVPALALKVVDRVGAGDTFMALTAPVVSLGAPIEVAGFLGNVAGAEAVATVGHRRYLERVPLIKHVQVLLK